MALVRVNEQGRRIGESHRNARHSDEDVERAIAAYEVLRPAGAEHTPEQQGAGQCDACRHSALRHALSLANMVHLRGRFAVAKLAAQVAATRRHAPHVALFSFGRHQALP